jgi:predicted ATPase/DNA-binding winged helix-turn-helix (wHTH) protein
MSKRLTSRIYEFEGFRLDAAHSMLYREGAQISLPPKAVETLVALVARGGEILSKDELMETIWTDSIVEESNLSQYLHLLRKVLGKRRNGKPFIETLRRRGYRFVADVSIVETSGERDLPNFSSSSGIIGREGEITEILQLLKTGDVRLLTLTGVGGVGKTTLAQTVARRLRGDFADGVFFVELAAITDPELVVSTIASLLGVKETGGEPIFELLKDYLREREMLLIVDNFEQVISAAPRIAQLISAAESLKIVVTSRVRLHLGAEVEFVVPSLAVPSGKWLDEYSSGHAGGSGLFDKISACDAVRLFIERARNVKPKFALTDENAGDVAEICSRLDGLPLAIELAAARTKLMPPAAILARLQSQLSLLTGGAKHLPVRQQTMRGTIEWSHDLLDVDEKILFRRLSVFAGGFTIETAERVCSWRNAKDSGEKSVGESFLQRSLSSDDESQRTAARPPLTVLDGITSLLDKSLLVSSEQSGGEVRFRMQEVVREYAQEALETSGEREAMNRRHAGCFLALGEEAKAHLLAARSSEWLNRLEEEHDNLRAALHWGLRNDSTLGQKLAGAIWRFWWHRGHIREGCEQLGALLSKTDVADKGVRTEILLGAGFLNRLRGNFDLTRTYVEEGLTLARETGDKKSQAFSLYQLGLLALNEDDFINSRRLLEEGLTHAKASDDKQMLGLLFNGLGEFSRLQEDYGRAEDFYKYALAFNREVGDLARQTTNLINLGATALARKDLKAAGSFYRDGLEISSKMADMNGTLYCLEGVAGTYLAVRNPERAALLFGAAEALREANNLLIEPADRVPYEQSVALVRASLTEKAFVDLFANGRKLKLEEAVTLALAETVSAEINWEKTIFKKTNRRRADRTR